MLHQGTGSLLIPLGQALYAIDFPPEIHNRCVGLLNKMCAQDALLPGSLYLELPVDRTNGSLCHGGYADIFKCTYRDQEVAVKVLRVYHNDPPERAKKVSDYC